MMISYRAQRVLKQLGTTLLVLLVIAAVLMLCWFLWLQRYVVYTRDGARLDFSLSPQIAVGEVAKPQSTPQTSLDFVFNDGTSEEKPQVQGLERFSGYYITAAELTGNMDAVLSQVAELPKGTAIMLELKNTQGEFYYSSTLGRNPAGVDVARIDQLIRQLKEQEHYLIARIPAFQERAYFEGHPDRTSAGLLVKGTQALWEDNRGSYWLNPESDGARSYLVDVVTELRQLGFREVLFAQFQYPSTNSATLPADRLESLNQTAAMLVGTCATETFTVSFLRERVDLTIPPTSSRLYIQYATVTQVAEFAAQSGYEEPATRLVFLTEQADTRYDACCVLRPLEMAH